MPEYGKSGSITYYAKAVLPGEYVMDSVYATGGDTIVVSSPRSKVVVNVGK
jgi:hypothetical protein